MDQINWFIAHWAEISELLIKLIAALIGLAAAITTLCSILINKIIPILAADHPALPWVKLISKVSIVKPPPVEAYERPAATPPSDPGSAAGSAAFLLICILFISGCSYLHYKDISGREWSYTGFFRSIESASINYAGNNAYFSVTGAKSDTQALSQAVGALAGTVVNAP